MAAWSNFFHRADLSRVIPFADLRGHVYIDCIIKSSVTGKMCSFLCSLCNSVRQELFALWTVLLACLKNTFSNKFHSSANNNCLHLNECTSCTRLCAQNKLLSLLKTCPLNTVVAEQRVIITV